MAITVKHTKVSTIPDGDDSSLIRPSDWNADHTLVGLGTAAELDAGVANGVATLDGTGKVPISELPAAVIGALNYQGTWNASTNTPTLTSSVGTKGYYYVVNVAGTTNLDGITDWQVGDWVVFNGTVWQKVDNTDAGGDVVGPTSATDNAIARYDGTTGRVIQNSVVTVSDTGGIAGATTITDINYVDFNTAYATTLGVGQLGWDGNDTLGLGMSGGNVIQEIGLQTYIYGKATSAITKGQLIKKTGSNGSSGVITFAPTTANMTDSGAIIGIAAESIALNGFGYIISSGNIKGFNTTGSSSGETWADGDTLYYNPSGNGLMTKTKPSAPNMKTEVAIVINAGSGGSGSVAVEIIHGTQLGGTDSNVQITSVTGGQLLSYDQTNGYWKNTNLAAGTGISVNSATGGTITVTNSAPDQTVTLTGGTGISTSGTYPSFTITNTGVTSAVAGTGISVSGSTGAVTVTNTAPDQTVAIASGTGITVTGTYPNFTVTNSDRGSSQNIFKNVAVAGQSTVVADSNDDTLTLANGTGISITTNATTDTVTITNSAPDQTVSIAAGTGITTSGTYPNFTVTNAGVTSFSAGTTGLTPSTGTTGAVTLAGTLAIANGGTGATTQQTAINALAGAVTSGQYLRGNGTNVVMSAIQAADVPTLNQNTTGTASNVTGTVAIANGGTGATTAPNARTNLGATTVGSNMFTLTNPSAVTFPRFNADNTVSALDAATFRSAIGAGTGSGTVTSVAALTLGTTGTDLTSTVANGTTTPVITLNVPTASATNRGALSSADWTTFNNKAPAVTYTTNYVPFGQGTTTPNQSANFTYVTGTGSLTAPQMVASNGIVVNNRTISTSYSIPSGYSATSAGPITVASGVSVTVPSGGKWVVL